MCLVFQQGLVVTKNSSLALPECSPPVDRTQIAILIPPMLRYRLRTEALTPASDD